MGSVIPQAGQRWRKRGTKTVEVTVADYFGPGESYPPMVYIPGNYKSMLTLAEFLQEYEGPLPEKTKHDERAEYVPLFDPDNSKGWIGKHRLLVHVEGRGANRMVSVSEEICYDADNWKSYNGAGRLYLAPDEARTLVTALTKVLKRKGDEGV